MSVGTLVFISLALALGFIFCKRKKAIGTEGTRLKTRAPSEEEGAPHASDIIGKPTSNLDPNLPPYLAVAKDSNLRKNAKKMAEKTAELETEFKMMLAHVKENVLKESKVSCFDMNKAHNRYLDIGRLKGNWAKYTSFFSSL